MLPLTGGGAAEEDAGWCAASSRIHSRGDFPVSRAKGGGSTQLRAALRRRLECRSGDRCCRSESPRGLARCSSTGPTLWPRESQLKVESNSNTHRARQRTINFSLRVKLATSTARESRGPGRNANDRLCNVTRPLQVGSRLCLVRRPMIVRVRPRGRLSGLERESDRFREVRSGFQHHGYVGKRLVKVQHHRRQPVPFDDGAERVLKFRVRTDRDGGP